VCTSTPAPRVTKRKHRANKPNYCEESSDEELERVAEEKNGNESISNEEEQVDQVKKQKRKRKAPAKKKTDKKAKSRVASTTVAVADQNVGSSSDENILDCSSDDTEEPEPVNSSRLQQEKAVWNSPGWNINPCERQILGPRLLGIENTQHSELNYLLHFLPITYIQNVVIPETNRNAKKNNPDWDDIDLDVFLQLLGLLLAMEVYQIHGPRRSYWAESSHGLFPSMDFGKVMPRDRFEAILKYLTLSAADDVDQQVLDFVDKVNERFQTALAPGSFLTADESMIKSFHRNLRGKIKIIRKPRPVGNEIKNLADGASQIVVNLELYEGKDVMVSKEFVSSYGATTATTIRLTQPYHGSGRIIIADSWFGSIKTAVEMMKRGLYSVLIVKTAHKGFPRQLLGEETLERGKWVAYTTEQDGIKLQACRFQDLKIKDFVSTCGTALPGNPRVTKHHGLIARPKVAEMYLKYCAAIDIHNHARSGSCALEDVWHTKNPRRRQIAGILGFCFTNGYLAMKHFYDVKTPHHAFKMAAAAGLTAYQTASFHETRSFNTSGTTSNALLHSLVKLPNSRHCYYCKHGYATPRRSNMSTTYKCAHCDVPLCKPSKGI
jgi:hypothetical protein